jgi:putative ABC transport system permease protein
MAILLQDLRLAVRSMLRLRGFAATAIFTLALGMTLSTTAVVVMKAYLFQELPYPDADRLYSVRYGVPGEDHPRRLEQLDWQTLSDVIEYPVAWDLDMFYLIGGDHAESIPGAWVTQGFMEALGIRPALGRVFDSNAFAAGGMNVALISHRLWTSRFASDPDVVGRTFRAYVSDRPQEAEAFTIVGVLPSGFWHVNGYTDILAPLRGPTYPYMVRLRAGATPAQATARIATLVRSGSGPVGPTWTPTLTATHEEYVGRTRPVLRAATAASLLVLLVACTNVAVLLLVRAVGRQREMAVRTALGASRGAIARLLIAEAIVLGAVVTGLALTLTRWLLGALAPVIQQQLGRPAPGGASAFAIDWTTAGVAVAIGMLTALGCTLAPMVTSWRPRLQSVLQSGSRSATEGPRGRWMRAGLITLEIAASLTLLAGSTLMLRTVMTLLGTDLGISAEGTVMSSITLRQNRYQDAPARTTIFETIETRLMALPGTAAVGLTTAWPLQQPVLRSIETAGASNRAVARAGVHRVNAMYFASLAIPLVSGRAFSPADRTGSEPVVVVSESLARQLWPDGAALGRLILVPQEQERGEAVPPERVIVGVVRDVRQHPADIELADVYVPLQQAVGRSAFVLLRTGASPDQAIAPFRAAFRDIDPEISVQTARPLQMLVDELTARPRFLTALLGGFALVAALLALIGVSSVVAYGVQQREREIAVRIALGADPGRLARLFVRQGGVLLLGGLALGVLGASGAGRILESQLFGVTPRDPAALGLAVASFAAAGLLAIWLPSRKAAMADPARALRAD